MKTRTTKRTADTKQAAAIAPGIHLGVVELATKRSYRVRLANGDLLPASLAAGVHPELARECLRDRRTVLLVSSDKGLAIAGALQTSPTSPGDKVEVRSKHIELDGDETVVLRAGKTKLVLSADGSVKLLGDAMTMRLARVLRVLAANVELP